MALKSAARPVGAEFVPADALEDVPVSFAILLRSEVMLLRIPPTAAWVAVEKPLVVTTVVVSVCGPSESEFPVEDWPETPLWPEVVVVVVVTVVVPVPPPPPPVDTGRQVVSTSQCAQSKLIVSFAPIACPWNFPEASIVTPVKSTQPAILSHAKPESVPCPSFSTPPFAGARLIHPSFALHAYPVSAESETVTVLFVGAKFTNPATLLHAYLFVGSIVPDTA